MLAGRRSEFLGGGALLLILMGGLFLSFSRAAWGQFVLCAIVLMALMFVTSRSTSERVRIIAVAIVGVVRCRRVHRGAAVDGPGRGAVQGARVALAELRRRPHRPVRPLLPGDLDGARLSVRHGAAAIPSFPEAPHNVYLNSFIVRRLDLGRGLSHARRW